MIVERFKEMLRHEQIVRGLTTTELARTLEEFCRRLANPKDRAAKADWEQFCKKAEKWPVKRVAKKKSLYDDDGWPTTVKRR